MQGKKAYPYPEIVTGDKWHVMELQMQTHNQRQTILTDI